MLELERRSLELKLDGKVTKMAFPRVGQLELFQKKLVNLKEDEAYSKMREFFIELGMKKATFDSLEPPHIKMIMDEISGQKKS